MNLLHTHDYLSEDQALVRNERRTLLVVVLTALAMVAEIVAGQITGSMALLADGWHMASHAGALFISFAAYRLAKSTRLHGHFSFGAGKFIPLGGYTSAIILGIIAIAMAAESLSRLRSPHPIRFDEALIVAVIGLAVNVVSAFILGHGEHGHEHGHEHDHGHAHSHDQPRQHHHDHNFRSAYLHVMADAVTSIFAIIALGFGKFAGLSWLDPAMGIVGSAVILVWAVKLCRETAWELLDGHAKVVDRAMIQALLEDDHTKVADLHIWRVAPKAYACELVVLTNKIKGPDFYRTLIVTKLPIHHVIVEERLRA